MDRKRDFIDRILPYRLEAVEILGFALMYRRRWDTPVPMQIFFDGKLGIEGLSTAFTNAAIEAGIVHARALLEFIGLGLNRRDHTKLVQRNSRGEDDLGIEHFSDSSGPLPLVSPAQAVRAYSDPNAEAERALARVFHIANKGLAHETVGLIPDPDDINLVEGASRCIRVLLAVHFYTPLGLQPPPNRITQRRP